MSLFSNRIQAPTKTLSAEWIPEDGEIFRDSSGNVYVGDNVTPSDELDPISGTGSVASATCGIPFIYDNVAPTDTGNSGAIRMNDTVAADVTVVTLGHLDLNNVDQTAYLDLFTSGLMKIYTANGQCLVFKVTRMINKLSTDNYFEFTVEHVSGDMPVNLENIRMDAVMDAPGVREFIADLINEGGASWMLSYIHKDSLVETPTLEGISDTRVILESINSFLVESTHAMASGSDETGIPVYASCLADVNSVDIRLSASVSASGNPLQVAIKVFNA